MKSVFYMWETRRADLIAKHKFYVSEGKIRLTDQFSDKVKLEKEADEFSKAWLEKMSNRFDPDRHDPGEFYERANDEGIGHYSALDELGNFARLALISGMFHLWERSLREWLTSNDGIGHFQMGNQLPKKIWKSTFVEVLEIFEGIDLFQNGCSIRDRLDTCRMVVNTYKHGAGDSQVKLQSKRPDLFDQYGWRSQKQYTWYVDSADYSDLYVETSQIDEFSGAIISFWQQLPEHILENEFQPVPKWFQKAHEKDCQGARNAN